MDKTVVASTENKNLRLGAETNDPFSECTISKIGFQSQKCKHNFDSTKTENSCEKKPFTGTDRVCQFDFLNLDQSGIFLSFLLSLLNF